MHRTGTPRTQTHARAAADVGPVLRRYCSVAAAAIRQQMFGDDDDDDDAPAAHRQHTTRPSSLRRRRTHHASHLRTTPHRLRVETWGARARALARASAVIELLYRVLHTHTHTCIHPYKSVYAHIHKRGTPRAVRDSRRHSTLRPALLFYTLATAAGGG